jgi:hypothetical protein
MFSFAISASAVLAAFFFKNKLRFVAVWTSEVFFESPVNFGVIPCDLAFFFTARQFQFAVDVMQIFACFFANWALKH